MKKLLALLLIVSGCRMPGSKSGLTIINRSGHIVSVQTSAQYPDTSIQDSRPFGSIAPNGEFQITNKTDWAEIADASPGRKLIVFFFDDDTLHAYDWAVIRSAYKTLKRMELTSTDIRRNGYSVVFE